MAGYPCFAMVLTPWIDGWVQKTARTCPTRMRESFTLTNLIWLVRAFLKSCGSHIYSGLVTTRTKQVRFKCLSTPRRGPNNKPLAFVVPGAHSYELGGFLPVALLVGYSWEHSVWVFLCHSFCTNNRPTGNTVDSANREKNDVSGQVQRRSPHRFSWRITLSSLINQNI